MKEYEHARILRGQSAPLVADYFPRGAEHTFRRHAGGRDHVDSCRSRLRYLHLTRRAC